MVCNQLETTFELVASLLSETVMSLPLLCESLFHVSQLLLLRVVLASLSLIELEDLHIWCLFFHLFVKLCNLFLDRVSLLGKDGELALVEGVRDGSVLQMVFEALTIDVSL